MQISNEVLDQLLKDYQKPEDLIGEQGILKELTKRLLERALAGELTHHLGYEKHAVEGRKSGNSRNGTSPKTIIGDFGELSIDVPRDRKGDFQPKIIEKGQKRFKGFDEKVISLYARGLSTREITGHLEEIYGVDVSPGLISNITNEITQDVLEWQNRPLNALYPIVFFDAMRVKVRSEGRIKDKAVYLGLGIDLDGTKQLLGMWIQDTEGAKFWHSILTQLHNRGVRDIYIACIDGLTGFPDAIQNIFPQTQVQLCIVHMIRNSLKFVPYRDRKAVAADLKLIYSAPTLESAEHSLEQFAATWDKRFPAISASWKRHWPNVVPFLAYPLELRRVIYTTNAMEAVNRSLRKISKTRGVFPSDDSVKKLFFLAFRNITAKWTKPLMKWNAALNILATEYKDRFPLS